MNREEYLLLHQRLHEGTELSLAYNDIVFSKDFQRHSLCYYLTQKGHVVTLILRTGKPWGMIIDDIISDFYEEKNGTT